ncbi:MAG: FliM/FliN family flagellar motor switch protein [Acidimicrobiales bacterium]
MSSTDARAHDFSQPSPLSDEAIKGLSTALERSRGDAADILGAITRRPSTIETGELLEPIDLALARAQNITLFAVTGADQGIAESHALIALEERDAVAVTDLFIGGPGVGADRPLTEIEVAVLSTELPAIVAPLINAVMFDEQLDSSKLLVVEVGDPLPTNNRLVRLGVRLTVAERSIDIALLIPDPDAVAEAAPKPFSRAELADAVAAVEVELVVNLGEVAVAGYELEQLALGDVIRLDHSASDRVVAEVDGIAVLEGHVGDNHGRLALSVERIIQPSESEYSETP